jgi:hypothetical protein
MIANTRARTTLRTQLSVEDLEGRAVPASLAAPQIADDSGMVATQDDQGSSWSYNYNWNYHYSFSWSSGNNQTQNIDPQAAVKVVSRIFVNGELVMKVKGKPQFAAIGSAVGVDENGNQFEFGGTQIFVNGQHVGTFDGSPNIHRADPFYYQNKHGQIVKVVDYHITGTPYVPPVFPPAPHPDLVDEGVIWSGAYVG